MSGDPSAWRILYPVGGVGGMMRGGGEDMDDSKCKALVKIIYFCNFTPKVKNNIIYFIVLFISICSRGEVVLYVIRAKNIKFSLR